MTIIDPTELAEISAYCGSDFTEINLSTLPDEQHAWATRFTTRGYVLVNDDNGSDVWLRPKDKAFMLGYPTNDGIELHLHDDFFNGFSRADFATDDEYLDAVEQRFQTLWTDWSED